DLGDDRGAGFLDGLAGGQLGGLQGLDVGGAGGQRGLGDGLGEGQEVGVLGHEVGLGVDLHQHGLAAVLGDRDAAVGGHAAGLLVGLGESCLGLPVGVVLVVAVVLGQGHFALHHDGAGAFA